MPENWGVSDRAVAYWEGKGFPHLVARDQAAWERRKAVMWMYGQGMTMTQIAKALGRSRGRIHQIVWTCQRWRKNEKSPVLQYLTRWGELHALTKSKHTMQFIGWLGGGDPPSVVLYRRSRVGRPPHQHEKADH